MSIKVISTGGTIASTENSGDDATPSLSSDDLTSEISNIEDLPEVETEDFTNIPSSHMKIENMWNLAKRINTIDSDPNVQGIVVTHGTSTLEESAYFVDLCYNGNTPVVFTGAMRNPSLVSPDGPGNLLASIRTAADDQAGKMGVLVTFNDRVHAAREVTKVHSSAPDTFRAPEFGPLATIDEDRLTWRRRPINNDPTLSPDPSMLTNDVLALWVTVDMPERQIQAGMDAAAVCLAANGSGGHPPHIIPYLHDIKNAGVPLVATTRCVEGRLGRKTYGFPGSHATLRELGVYFSDLNLQKTRIRTILALASNQMDDSFDQPS